MTNQGFSADTWILTNEGPIQISNIKNRQIRVYNHNLLHGTDGSFKSGRNQIFEIVTKEGYKIRATSEQKLMAFYDNITLPMPVSKLTIRDQLHLHTHSNLNWNGIGTYEDGYLLGLVIGDGSFNGDYGILSFFPDDYAVIPYVLNILDEDHTCRPNYKNCITIYSKQIHTICKNYHLMPEKYITPQMESESSDFICGLASGMFCTDGSIRSKRLYVSLKQSNLQRLECIQRILFYLGILCRIYSVRKEAMESEIQGIKTIFNPNWELIISGKNAKTFYERVGFNHPSKNWKLKSQLKTKTLIGQEPIVEIKEIIPLGEEETWSMIVPSVTMMSVNGFIAQN